MIKVLKPVEFSEIDKQPVEGGPYTEDLLCLLEPVRSFAAAF